MYLYLLQYIVGPADTATTADESNTTTVVADTESDVMASNVEVTSVTDGDTNNTTRQVDAVVVGTDEGLKTAPDISSYFNQPTEDDPFKIITSDLTADVVKGRTTNSL